MYGSMPYVGMAPKKSGSHCIKALGKTMAENSLDVGGGGGGGKGGTCPRPLLIMHELGMASLLLDNCRHFKTN